MMLYQLEKRVERMGGEGNWLRIVSNGRFWCKWCWNPTFYEVVK